MKKKTILFFVSIGIFFGGFNSFQPPAQATERSVSADLLTTLRYLYQGSYNQFTTLSNLGYLGVAAPSTLYSFKYDDRILEVMSKRKRRFWHRYASDASIAFNFPLLSVAFYYKGYKSSSSKMVQFAMEYTAAQYLALVETGLGSYIQVHHRPDGANASFWETAFRGPSSFPSGHIIPFSILMFKTFQFYGPYWAIIPAVLTYWTGYERVASKKHYMSDVVAGFFVAAFASEGVRVSAGYKKNHPAYKWIFQHNARLGIIRYQNVIGPLVTWDY